MPYIPQADRNRAARAPVSAGELNYAVTKLVNLYWQEAPSYESANDIMGALEGAKLEFYRRVVVPYEDAKRAQNGDVYE